MDRRDASGRWGGHWPAPAEPALSTTALAEEEPQAGLSGDSPLVGVLALQGDVSEHLEALRRVGARAVAVRNPSQLEGLQGLVLPGGESTTMGRLLVRSGLLEPLRQLAAEGRLALYGTCAGLILLASEVLNGDLPRLGVMDMVVERNAYGRQVDSFEVDLPVPALGPEPLRAVFIRAPVVRRVGSAVTVLAHWQGCPVLVRQGTCLASSFHPELTTDLRLHRYFLQELVMDRPRPAAVVEPGATGR